MVNCVGGLQITEFENTADCAYAELWSIVWEARTLQKSLSVLFWLGLWWIVWDWEAYKLQQVWEHSADVVYGELS